MIDRRAQRDSSISIFRIIAVACAICVLVYFVFALATGIEPLTASVRWYSVRWKTAGALLPNPVPLTWLVQSWYAMLSPAK